ncbi:BppU family phage baseplate upper protein [Staphylococcus condimenti]|uniref:BppU family phage baseplate upper protein n=1 Tax=Staphylococcus condimenti TaxID=70255 RepID=UPI00254B5A12|nr:BppU family phage baseplate upper protein [Staphylococcus condimenti]MDK8646340.1 BppU family phage baseplate upper protein [Staphylococcus condimenti]
MELNKIAKYQAKNEPYLKPISDLGIGFYNLDENTATLQFRIYNNNGPLLISDENVDVHGYFESSNGSVSTVLKLKVVDGMNGIAQITLDKDFLQASTSTKVTGQIYVAVNNVTDNPNNNQTAVLGEFTFQVADALINKVSSFTKVEYIRMFDQLREEIKQRTEEMEQHIGNIETLVQEVNDTVDDGKKDITKISNDAISEINNIAQQGNDTVKQYANQAVTDIQTIADKYAAKLNDETNDKINQVNEASDKVLASIKNNNVVTKEQTENWQKYKLTSANGERQWLGTLENSIETLPVGLYECTVPANAASVNAPKDVNNSAYLAEIDVFQGVNGRKQIYLLQNFNEELWLKTIHTGGQVRDWVRVNNIIRDSGWLPLTLKNAYKTSTTPDFAPSYRVIDNGNYKQVYIRLGVEQIVNGKNVVATIPKEFAPNKIYSLGVSTNSKIPPKVIISGGDIEFHTNEADSYSTTDYIIYQDSWIV